MEAETKEKAIDEVVRLTDACMAEETGFLKSQETNNIFFFRMNDVSRMDLDIEHVREDGE